MQKHYPNQTQSWGVLGIAILSAIVFSFVMLSLQESAGQEVAFFVYYVLSMGGTFVLVHFLRKKLSGVDKYPLKPFSIAIIPGLIIALLGIQLGITLPVADLIPMPEVFKDLFRQLGDMDGILSFMTIAIAAPILEEFIFRGIVLEGLLRNYSPRKAILLSAFLFGIVHLNPWQFVSAMAIGCLAGWVYYRGRNLWLPIFIHFANNSLAFVSGLFMDQDMMIDEPLMETYGGATNYYLIIGLALAGLIGGIFLLNKQLTSYSWDSVGLESSKNEVQSDNQLSDNL